MICCHLPLWRNVYVLVNVNFTIYKYVKSIYIIRHFFDDREVSLDILESTNSNSGSTEHPDRSSASANLSMLAALFCWCHSPRISLTTFIVWFGWFVLHWRIFSNLKPSSKPKWMYWFDMRSETASRSCGVAWCFFMWRKYLGYSSIRFAIR